MIKTESMEISEKQKNMLLILDCIEQNGEVSASDIYQKTGLSIPTISRALIALRKLRCVAATGKEEGNGSGRKAEIYRFNYAYGYVAHFYFETVTINCYLADLEGNVVATAAGPLHKDVGVGEFADMLREFLEELEKKARIPRKKIIAAGLAVPGSVDEVNRTVKHIPNLIKFHNANLLDRVTDALNLPVIMHNCARLSAMGEYIRCYADYRHLAYMDFTSESGVGSGIVLNGQIFGGSNNVAGEIGDAFISVDDFGGKRTERGGFYENIACVAVLVDKAKALLEEGKAKGLEKLAKGGKIDFNVIERAAEKDPDIAELYDQHMRMWAMGAINLLIVLDPDILLLGGTLGPDNKLTLETIRRYVREAVVNDVDIRLSVTGENAQLYGGLHMLKEYVLNHIIARVVISQA